MVIAQAVLQNGPRDAPHQQHALLRVRKNRANFVFVFRHQNRGRRARDFFHEQHLRILLENSDERVLVGEHDQICVTKRAVLVLGLVLRQFGEGVIAGRGKFGVKSVYRGPPGNYLGLEKTISQTNGKV